MANASTRTVPVEGTIAAFHSEINWDLALQCLE